MLTRERLVIKSSFKRGITQDTVSGQLSSKQQRKLEPHIPRCGVIDRFHATNSRTNISGAMLPIFVYIPPYGFVLLVRASQTAGHDLGEASQHASQLAWALPLDRCHHLSMISTSGITAVQLGRDMHSKSRHRLVIFFSADILHNRDVITWEVANRRRERPLSSDGHIWP